jgi:hypothetical protein
MGVHGLRLVKYGELIATTAVIAAGSDVTADRAASIRVSWAVGAFPETARGVIKLLKTDHRSSGSRK